MKWSIEAAVVIHDNIQRPPRPQKDHSLMNALYFVKMLESSHLRRKRWGYTYSFLILQAILIFPLEKTIRQIKEIHLK